MLGQRSQLSLQRKMKSLKNSFRIYRKKQGEYRVYRKRLNLCSQWWIRVLEVSRSSRGTIKRWWICLRYRKI